jgi:RNA polymerase subunit RPABC4/transcription elongation factor Spt4
MKARYLIMQNNSDNANNTKFCKHCGNIIDIDCVVCPQCGKQVEDLKQAEPGNIFINNNANAAATPTTTVTGVKVRRKYSLLLDIVLICCTCGLWIIWMLIRPKYEYV